MATTRRRPRSRADVADPCETAWRPGHREFRLRFGSPMDSAGRPGQYTRHAAAVILDQIALGDPGRLEGKEARPAEGPRRGRRSFPTRTGG